MSKRLLLLTLALILPALLLAACAKNDAEESSVPTITVQDAYARLEANDQAIIVDVREPREWATTGVPVGAVLISLGQVAQRAAELPQDREILLICNSGNRSRVAAETLVKLGYPNVVNVDGGIQAWLKAGLAVQPYTP